MKTATFLLHQLQIDEVDFENDYIERYMRFCNNLAIAKQLPFQNVLANSAISKWYDHEISKLQKEAIQLIQISKGSFNEKRKIYSQTLTRIFAIYPSALMDGLKDVKIINPITPLN